MKPGALQYLIDFVNKYSTVTKDERPFVYFLNGENKHLAEINEYNTFDEFVRNLSIWSSCSTGMGFWKDDFDELSDKTVFNDLFPHTTILFSQRKRKKYIIDNTLLLAEQQQGLKPKGSYDLYFAFTVEYLGILTDLLRNRDIGFDTFRKLKKDNLIFVENLYFDYNILKKYCSYDLSGFDKSLPVYYSTKMVKMSMFFLFIKRSVYFLLRLLKRIFIKL